jgi:hypothetical protein
VMRSDWQAHADHRFVSRWWTSRPVERTIVSTGTVAGPSVTKLHRR